MRAPSPLGLSEARRGSTVFTNMLIDSDPPPRRFNELKTPPLASHEPVTDTRAPSQFFKVG